MKHQAVKSLLVILAAMLVTSAVGWAGSHGSVVVAGLSVFVWAAVLAFLIQWVVFVPSYLAQTEHYFDLTGSLSFLTVLLATFLMSGRFDARSCIMVALVSIWALRLGGFLFLRIRRQGVDHRFDIIKASFSRFLMTWTLQGLWVFLTLAATLAALTSTAPAALDLIGVVGVIVWAVGFTIEAISDAQKSAFRKHKANAGRPITTGLWAWSRHPNYFGEIALWLGMALIALPSLSGWQHVTLISPLFVYLLLTRVSGIPILEARAQMHWGDDPEFQDYKARTPMLVPRPPR